MRLTFLGGVGTVTGSKYLVEISGTRVLVDCGLFQGFKNLRQRNWAPLPIDPKSIHAVLLTHAHIDHSGYLPLLVRNGFSGRIYCTEATRDLCEILLSDSGFLQERDAEFANRHRFSKHHPARPLYSQADAERSLRYFCPVPFNEQFPVTEGADVIFSYAGHILGAAIVRLTAERTSLQFSGDLGRPKSATMHPPAIVTGADFLVLESTYGDRRHDREDPEALLADIINRTVGRGGAIIIPAFAVGRTQTILYHLHRLKRQKRIPDMPIFLDSPMAIDASEIFCRYAPDHSLSAKDCRAACNTARYVRSAEDSKALDENNVPMVLISASGMATGGRILHHLKHFLTDSRNTVLLAGFQAGGTRGAALVHGAEAVKIHGVYVPVKAEISILDMLSAHADADEIMEWLRNFRDAPRMTFITHGEPNASDALRHRIEEDLGWTCSTPEYRDEIELTGQPT